MNCFLLNWQKDSLMITREELIKLIHEGRAKWNEMRESKPSLEIDLNRLILKDFDFSEYALNGVNFRDSTFTGTNFNGANLTASHLSGADLSFAKLNRAKLTFCNLSVVNLDSAELSEADLSGSILHKAKLMYADLHGADLSDSILESCQLNAANLTYANLTYANLNDANLTNANLTIADLTNANLTNADLTNADLSDADLTNALLAGVKFRGAYLVETDLTVTDFGSCDLEGAYLKVNARILYNGEILTLSEILLDRLVSEKKDPFELIRKRDELQFTTQAASNPITLLLDLELVDEDQVIELMSNLSELYRAISGDELVIAGMRILETQNSPNRVLA